MEPRDKQTFVQQLRQFIAAIALVETGVVGRGVMLPPDRFAMPKSTNSVETSDRLALMAPTNHPKLPGFAPAPDDLRGVRVLGTPLPDLGDRGLVEIFPGEHVAAADVETFPLPEERGPQILSTPAAQDLLDLSILRQDNGDERQTNVPKAQSKVWQSLKPYKGGIKTNGETGKKQRFYEWDHTHNDIEVYDRNKKHLGSMDPTSGEMYKGPRKYRIKED